MIYELDPSQNFDIRPSTENDDRKRRFFGRSGGVAVRGVEQFQEPDSVLGFSEEFGVDEQMGEYRDLWNDYSGIVESFTGDDEVHELFDDMIGFGSIANEGTRAEKRKLQPRRDKDFSDIVMATALVARVLGASLADAKQGEMGLKDAKVIINSNKVLRGKLFGIVTGFTPSAARTTIESKIETLEHAIRRKNSKIIQTENGIINSILKKITEPSVALRLIEGFIDTGSSEAEDDKAFIRFLATNHVLQSNDSLVGQALHTVRETAETGGIAKSFLQGKIDEDEGDNLYAFMARKLDGPERFTDVIARDFEHWPADMKQEYIEFSTQYVASLSTSVHRVANQNVAKLWVHPTRAMCETFLDDTFHRFHGKYAQGGVQKLSTAERQANMRVGTNVQVSVMDGVFSQEHDASKEALEEKKLAVIANGMNGVAIWQHEGISVDDVIDMFIKGHKISKEFRAELKMIIEKIQREPFGEGTQLLHLSKRKPNSTKFYRINPVHAGMPVADAKKARIIFAVDGDQLGIYSITSDHDQYETVLKGLLGTKM